MYEKMIEIWKAIIEYGPRPIGSENFRQCSDYVLSQMQSLTAKAWKDEKPFDAWDVNDYALETEDGGKKRAIKSYVFLNSGSSKGFTGTVKYAGKNRVWDMYVWDRYMVIDDSGNVAAYITVRGNGKPIPQMLFEGRSDVPHFLVGKSEAEFLKSAERKKIRFSGFADTYIRHGSYCRNVVGILPKAAPKIVICGHCDTVYSTKGAYDNSSGAAVVLELARQIRNRQRNYEIEFLITDGEEFNLVGSRQRVEECEGEDIRFVLNIDGVGRDKTLEIWSGPEIIERRIRSILNQSRENFWPVYICPPPPGSDHAPYFAKGIPTCMLTFNDQEILHSPDDVYRESLISNMEVMVRISMDLLEKLGIIDQS
jgi:hypothetical protein